MCPEEMSEGGCGSSVTETGKEPVYPNAYEAIVDTERLLRIHGEDIMRDALEQAAGRRLLAVTAKLYARHKKDRSCWSKDVVIKRNISATGQNEFLRAVSLIRLLFRKRFNLGRSLTFFKKIQETSQRIEVTIYFK